MQSLWNVYHDEMPPFVAELASTPAMLRLKDIGMHCGCEYTRFPQYVGAKPYSRWTHSVAVALIVWHFTSNMAQTVAGLLHDIASPTFAHAIDFLHGDYLAQESTEEDTESIIRNSPELMALLQKYGLTVAQVCDYHIYPLADNDSPRLSADRLEYTLGNAFGHNHASLEEIRALYDDLTIAENEEGQPEIQFRTEACAVRFSWHSLTNSRVYICDENRFAMQALADILRAALDSGAIAETDLHSTESAIIQRLCADPDLRARWNCFAQYATILRSSVRPDNGYWVNVDTKRRHIDPKVADSARVTALCPEYKSALSQFLTHPLTHWLSAAN